MPEIRKLKWKKMTRTETSKNSNGKKAEARKVVSSPDIRDVSPKGARGY